MPTEKHICVNYQPVSKRLSLVETRSQTRFTSKKAKPCFEIRSPVEEG
jgi:hypothetical protein